MCVYCYCGDWAFRHDPPWRPGKRRPWHPAIPDPIPAPYPYRPWSLDRLREYEELLRRIKALEDQIGCPCEPNKADYLDLFRKRIEGLEAGEDDLDLSGP